MKKKSVKRFHMTPEFQALLDKASNDVVEVVNGLPEELRLTFVRQAVVQLNIAIMRTQGPEALISFLETGVATTKEAMKIAAGATATAYANPIREQ